MPVEKSDGTTMQRLVLPYTLDTNDMRFSSPQGFNTGDHFFAYLKDAFDVLYAEGDEAPKMLNIGLHCRLIGRPGRQGALARPRSTTAFATRRIDIARHWQAHFPAPGTGPAAARRRPRKHPMSTARTTRADPDARAVQRRAGRAGAGLAGRAVRAFAVDRRGGAAAAAVREPRSLAALVREAGREPRAARAHPELAGKAMVTNTLTAESTNEQTKSGLTNCSPEELATFQQLNAAYNAKFQWPFLLAVRGPRGTGLTRAEIIATFQRRLDNHPEFELAECLRNIHRIVEMRLDDKFGVAPVLGNEVWDWHEQLARHTDPGYAELGQLTVTYLTDAHRACAAQLAARMRDSGFDEVRIDAVGNVVGVYHGSDPAAKRLLTGSHYDTVRNGGSTTAGSASWCPWPRQGAAPRPAAGFRLRGGRLRGRRGPALQGHLLGPR